MKCIYKYSLDCQSCCFIIKAKYLSVLFYLVFLLIFCFLAGKGNYLHFLSSCASHTRRAYTQFLHLALITHPHLIQIATDTFAQLLVTDTWEKGGGWRDTQTGGWRNGHTERQTDRQQKVEKSSHRAGLKK